MKKIISFIVCLAMLCCLSSAAIADTIGPWPLYPTPLINVKKANPENVIKDGIIGNCEYEEFFPSEEDLNFSWWSWYSNDLSQKSEDFSKNVHFYFSWDEANGLNIAAKATLLEDPVCTVTQGEIGTGDSFIGQFGMTASIVESDDPTMDVAIASLGYNTDTETPLYGTYSMASGYTESLMSFTVGKNFAVSVNGREITYELSLPIEDISKADRPFSAASLNLTLTGGSRGYGYDKDCESYAVSLGTPTYNGKWNTDQFPAELLFADQKIDCPVPFDDVSPDSWYSEYVNSTFQSGLMKGTSINIFSPESMMDRAMAVTAIHRLAGKPTAAESSPFLDLSEDWYKNAVNWAYENGIVKGKSKTDFAPTDPITREEFATLLYRLANYMGNSTNASADITHFPDYSLTSNWAADALKWAVSEGLITGSGKDSKLYLLPTCNAIRAEAATILIRFIDMKR